MYFEDKTSAHNTTTKLNFPKLKYSPKDYFGEQFNRNKYYINNLCRPCCIYDINKDSFRFIMNNSYIKT